MTTRQVGSRRAGSRQVGSRQVGSLKSAANRGSGPPDRVRTAGGSALGQRGEDVAADYLVGLGYRIIARNWRCRIGEIDLIAAIVHEARSKIIFCEVKTRAGYGWGDPLEAITYRKRKRLRQLAGVWLATSGEHADDLRMDAIGVMLLPGTAPQVKHVPGID